MLIPKKGDSDPVCDKFLRTKINFYGDEATDVHDKEIPKADSNLICLTVISLNSALNKDGNYYPQVFLKECKYIKKLMIRHIMEDREIFCDDSDEYDEKQIKAIKLMILEKKNLKMYILLKQPLKS